MHVKQDGKTFCWSHQYLNMEYWQGCIKAGFFIKSPAGRLKLVKTGFYWSKLAEIFSKQISQNGTDKFNYCNQEHNVKQHNH